VRRPRYVDGVELLYISTNGSADATKASIPWHLIVNGSIEVGQTARIVLAGDASEIVKADVRSALEGVGVPPLRDLVATWGDRRGPRRPGRHVVDAARRRQFDRRRRPRSDVLRRSQPLDWPPAHERYSA
jgi:hypothetical protein